MHFKPSGLLYFMNTGRKITTTPVPLTLLRYAQVILRAPLFAFCLCTLISSPLVAADISNAVPSSIVNKTIQRKSFSDAKKAIARRQYSKYQTLADQLGNYPLVPYLHYQYISKRLTYLPYADIDTFLADNPKSYLGDKLRREWLTKLAKQSRWEDVIRYYDKNNTNIKLTCSYLNARLATGDTSAFTEIPELWNVDHSQPKVCDPIFKQWIAAGHLTTDIAWQRFSKALNARRNALATYAAKYLPPTERALTDLYTQIHRHPQQLKHIKRFGSQTPEMQEIILHGLKRLAKRDIKLARDLWHRYDAQQLFEDQARMKTQHTIAVQLLRQGFVDETEAFIAATPLLNNEKLVQWLARDALRKQDWNKVDYWVAKLSPVTQQSHRWNYWKARSLIENKDPAKQQQAHKIYTDLAMTRSFYGFLSADIMNLKYRLVDKPIDVTDDEVNAIKQLPGVRRARELYILGETNSARREWFHTTRSIDEQQIIAAGKVAESWGWHRNSIQAMIQAKYWDDLELRFPLAYQKHVNTAAQKNSINPHLLFAIARQESAFTPDAKSPAGALGLMQLMPSTAKQTAHRAGMSFSTYDLLRPEINIKLGSRYLNQLLNQFNGNRILATAAYNAGPSRVKGWLSKAPQSPLPFDIWIETIPFGETRGYVQNVLAYSVIYGYRLGDNKPFITAGEAKKTL